MTNLYLAFRNDKFEEIKKIVKDIRSQDSSFEYGFLNSKNKENADKILRVKCKDKDSAYRKGTWLFYKTSLFLFYWVK